MQEQNRDIYVGYPKTELNPNGDPLPTQEKFHNSQAKYRFLVGGWGTGKTTSICLELLLKDIPIPNNYILLGRKDLQELKSTTLKELLDYCPPEIMLNHNKQDRLITFINGTEIFYTNLDESREAFNKISSLNLGCAVIDQGEELTEKVFNAIKGRLRRNNSRRCFYGAFNPEGHNWQYRVCKSEPINNMECWEAVSTENIYLPPDYVQELLDLPERIRKRYVFCSYDDFEGLVYEEFTESLNVINVYEPQENDTHYIIEDYGFRNPNCLLFASTNFDGDTFIYDEYYGSGKRIKDITDEAKKHKYFKKTIKLADPSIWNVQRDGISVGDDFMINHQLTFLQADNSVSQGIDRVNTLFKSKKLFITKNCVDTLREIGNYKWRELKPGQVRNEYEEPLKKDDHAMDAIRYLANYIYTPIEEKEETETERQQAHRLHVEGDAEWACYVLTFFTLTYILSLII